MQWDNQVDFLKFPLIEERFNCNIFVIDMENIPILNSKIDVWNVLMYKSVDRQKEKYWLLYDNNHYHAITNIKGFLAVKYFCDRCLTCFEHKATIEKHECDDKHCKTKLKKNKDKRINKALPHYMSSKECKGSEAE